MIGSGRFVFWVFGLINVSEMCGNQYFALLSGFCTKLAKLTTIFVGNNIVVSFIRAFVYYIPNSSKCK